MKRLSSHVPGPGAAFTLIELLFVCVVLGILLGLAAPAVGSLLRSSRLNHAAALLVDECNLARQMAMTKNRNVEVRFYKLPDDDSTQNLQHRAVRLHLWSSDVPDDVEPAGELKRLPSGVIVSADSRHSTLLDFSNPNRRGLLAKPETLPGRDGLVESVGFCFRPDGSTTLEPVDLPEGNWFLTFFLEDDSTHPQTGLPANFGTLQVEPLTGRVRLYRP